MVHKQQMGHSTEDVARGLCQALVRNYLADLGAGREIEPPVVFQGGVAFNEGIVRALEESLQMEVIVPLYHEAMGAIGAALLVREEMSRCDRLTGFAGFGVSEASYRSLSFECEACPDRCEVAQLFQGDRVVAHWGGHCDLWEGIVSAQA
jgi:hypothetical protein